MNLQELTELLVTSSEQFNQTKFIPWRESNHKDFTYKYHIWPVETVKEAGAGSHGLCHKIFHQSFSPLNSLPVNASSPVLIAM